MSIRPHGAALAVTVILSAGLVAGGTSFAVTSIGSSAPTRPVGVRLTATQRQEICLKLAVVAREDGEAAVTALAPAIVREAVAPATYAVVAVRSAAAAIAGSRCVADDLQALGETEQGS